MTLAAAVGLGALVGPSQVAARTLALAFYGAGIGLESIARGTLPLALFGSNGYAQLMGRLAMPSLIAQAAAPSLGALLLERFVAYGTLATLSGLALINVALACGLGWLIFSRRGLQIQPQ